MNPPAVDHWKNQLQQPAPAPNMVSANDDTDKAHPQGTHNEGLSSLKLLPTKAYQCQEVGSTDAASQGVVYKAFPNAPVRWTAQPVLEWMESLVAATEEGEAHDPPILVDGVAMSAPTPPLPVQYQPQETAGAKAVLDHGLQQPIAVPKNWDLSYITLSDPFAWRYLRPLAQLAVQYEALSSKNDNDDDQEYRLIQSRLEFTFGRLLGQHPYETFGEHDESRFLVNTLYQETIQKLQALYDKVSGASVPDPIASRGKVLPGSSAGPKKDLATYMTAWLRDNWTNPYPDEAGLAEMARDCDSTPTVVSNWLINARTRKWRPAIVKATELHRPSDYLLEDSINIFDGKPVRELYEYHSDSYDDDEYDTMSL